MSGSSLEQLKGIGPKKATLLAEEAGITSIEDLLYYAPRRYHDRSTVKAIADVIANESLTVSGTVEKVYIAGARKKFLTVVISDGTDTLSALFFGGIRYFQKLFHTGDQVLFSGTIKAGRTKQMVHPEFDRIDTHSTQGVNTGRIIPLYPSTEVLKAAGLDSRGFRKIIMQALNTRINHIVEPLPAQIIKSHNFISLTQALHTLHFPESLQEAATARERLAFNEVFIMQYYLALSKEQTRRKSNKIERAIHGAYRQDVIDKLPFTLTPGQKDALHEIEGDLASSIPMNRLLQGDVGSGKTIVSALAALLACSWGKQVAFMAPTELLARQHFATFKSILPEGIKCDLLTGSIPETEKESLYIKLSKGIIQIIIGTHALIQKSVTFNNLGFVIIDEQHKFGVHQRAALRGKGKETDLLVMTATPIPRSLSMTIYGDLDISLIKEKPAQRGTIETLIFPDSRIKAVYNSLNKYMNQGRQIYYVLPLIDESDKVQLKTATETYKYLAEEVFPKKRIGLIHGKLKNEDKNDVMEKFISGEIDLLVATTVVEVGIDVSNATIIVIEHAERFGLSQLHQLRGRVGRGKEDSFCVFIHPDDLEEENKKRLNVLQRTDDGFEIAEEDLKIRGAGELIGTKQHGNKGDFEFIQFERDLALISAARSEAIDLVAAVNSNFESKESSLIDFVESKFPGLRTKSIFGILS